MSYNEYHIHVSEAMMGQKYYKLDHKIILDKRLTRNDICIYIAIVRLANFEDDYTEITGATLKSVTGILESAQGISVDKLESLGYIEVELRFSKAYKITNSKPKRFEMLSAKQIKLMKEDKIQFIRSLKYLILANGNNMLPSIRACKLKTDISKTEYYKLRNMEQYADTDIYDNLIIK
jgi:hypothetical protein